MLVDDFKADAGLLAANQQDGEWALAMLPEEGVYQMRIQPNRLAWSTVGADALTNFSLEASMIVSDVTPAGYTGLIGRYQDRHNFYLFAVNGRGQFQVQLLRMGELQTLIPWTESHWLNPAGQSNQVALVDNEQELRFYANGAPLFSVPEPQLPPGDAGIFGAAPPETMAEIDLDWLQLYALTKE